MPYRVKSCEHYVYELDVASLGHIIADRAKFDFGTLLAWIFSTDPLAGLVIVDPPMVSRWLTGMMSPLEKCDEGFDGCCELHQQFQQLAPHRLL